MAIGFCIGDFFELSSSVVILVRVALILFSAVVVFLFYEIQFFERLILKWKLTKRFSKYLEAYEHIGRVELTQVLALSFLRYMIYATQFVLLMQLFDLNYSLSKMYLSIMLTLYGITLVPTVAISEPAVRASVAGRILGVYNDKSDLIMVATLSLWFVNLVIPAVFGAITLLNIKLKSK